MTQTLGSLVLVELFVPRSANVRSFGWASDRVVLLELPFQTGRADVSVRGESAARNAVGGHRTLNKTDSPFCAGLSLSTRRAAQARETVLL